MPAASEPLVFTWCKERVVDKRNDKCLYCCDAAVFSWWSELGGIQLPAFCYGSVCCQCSLWKSSGFVEWERECALQKLCEAYVSVPVPSSWESSGDCAVSWRLWSLNLLSVLFSVCTSLGRGSRVCSWSLSCIEPGAPGSHNFRAPSTENKTVWVSLPRRSILAVKHRAFCQPAAETLTYGNVMVLDLRSPLNNVSNQKQ